MDNNFKPMIKNVTEIDTRLMNGKELIKSSREYLDYLDNHLDNIWYAFIELSEACHSMPWVYDDYNWWRMRESIKDHDVSKLSKEEFTQYRDRFYGVERDANVNLAYADALEHHLSCNHHHQSVENVDDVVHMVIDWMAMSYEFGNTPWDYYNTIKDDVILTMDQSEYLDELLVRLRLHRGAYHPVSTVLTRLKLLFSKKKK